jgi:hypothetical protein
MVKALIDSKFKGASLDLLYGNNLVFMKMESNTYLEIVLKNKTKTIHFASTMLKVIWKSRRKLAERKNFTVYIRKVQLAMKHYHRDISMIKRKNAANVIKREWIVLSEPYFKKKRRVLIMALQKYIKKVIDEREFERKYSSIVNARNKLISIVRTQRVANNYDTFISMRNILLHSIFETAWERMCKHYLQLIEQHSKTFLTLLRNRGAISRAREKERNRLHIKSHKIITRCLRAIPYFSKFAQFHHNVVKLQKCIKMSLARHKYSDLKSKVELIQREWRRYR